MAILIDRRFHCPKAGLHLPDSVPYNIKRYGTFCKDKACRSLEGQHILTHSINSDFKGNIMFLISNHLKECGIPWGSCGILPCSILLQRGPHSFDRVYHYFEAGP